MPILLHHHQPQHSIGFLVSQIKLRQIQITDEWVKQSHYEIHSQRTQQLGIKKKYILDRKASDFKWEHNCKRAQSLNLIQPSQSKSYFKIKEMNTTEKRIKFEVFNHLSTKNKLRKKHIRKKKTRIPLISCKNNIKPIKLWQRYWRESLPLTLTHKQFKIG